MMEGGEIEKVAQERMPPVSTRLPAALSLMCTAMGSLSPLQDSRPSLSTTMSDNSKALEWWAGGPAFALASAGAVRLNFRGVHTYDASAKMRSMKGQWTTVPCNASAWALCKSEVGDVMPWSSPRTPESPRTVPGGWGGLQCKDGHSKTLVSLGVYDISACDIIDEGLDVVYSKGLLSHRSTSMPLWRYWVCVGLAIVLVRALSYNVQGLWDRTSQQTSHPQWPGLVSSLGVLALVLVDWDWVYITKADQVFFWSAVSYVGFYLLMHLAPRVDAMIRKSSNDQGTKQDHARTKAQAPYEQPVFNVIVGTLQVGHPAPTHTHARHTNASDHRLADPGDEAVHGCRDPLQPAATRDALMPGVDQTDEPVAAPLARPVAADRLAVRVSVRRAGRARGARAHRWGTGGGVSGSQAASVRLQYCHELATRDCSTVMSWPRETAVRS
jgi:hypothetical protein